MDLDLSTEAARAAFVKQYAPLVHGFARRYMRGSLGRYYELADLESEGAMAVLAAARTWRADGGASFLTYARRACIHSLEGLRKPLRAKKTPGRAPRDQYRGGRRKRFSAPPRPFASKLASG